MKTHVTDEEPVPATARQPAHDETTPAEQRWPEHKDSGGGRSMLIVGVVLAFVGLGALVGGARALMAYQDRDSAGYYSTGAESFATDSYAMSSPPDFTGMGPDVLYARDLLGSIRISGENTASGDSLFIGIGPADEVAAYLADVGHDEVSDIELSPFSAEYSAQPGGAPAEEPTSQTFWTESVSGTGTQTLTAEVPAGEWSVVVMNADGSAGVGADLSVGATLPIIGWVAFSALVIGGVLFLAGIALVLLGLRKGA
jgi:hypothetical protein